MFGVIKARKLHQTRCKVPIYTSRREKLKRKKLINQNIAQNWSSYYDLFTESKNTHIKNVKSHLNV